MKINGVKVFSATMMHERQVLGDRVTEWMRDHESCDVVDVTITQSSDSSFHCIAITLFYFDPAFAARTVPPARRLAFEGAKR